MKGNFQETKSMSPLISCLCVTRKKVDLLERAIKCFEAQSYCRKELLVVYEDDDDQTRAVVHNYKSDRVNFLEVQSSPKMTLGSIRNLAIELCNGEYFCQWDDDDWYHNQRLEIQMECLKNSCKPASILVHWILFNSLDGRAYMSYPHPWEGSILCEKKIHKSIQYANLEKGEDSYFINSLIKRNLLVPIVKPTLYIYIYHGKNTWDYSHFESIFDSSTELSLQCSLLVKDILNGKYTNDESSKILFSELFLKEINYFSWIRL